MEGSTKERMDDVVDSTKERMDDVEDSVKNRADDVEDSVEDKMKESAEEQQNQRAEKQGEERNLPEKNPLQGFAVAVLLCFLFVLFLLGAVLPLRKKYSAEEKRAFRTFPEFSWKGLVKGSYFQDISAWYQDSYPGKEYLLSLDEKVESLYGLQGKALYGGERNNDTVKESIPETGAIAETFSLTKNAGEENKAESGETVESQGGEQKEKTKEEETGKAPKEETDKAQKEDKEGGAGTEQSFETDAAGNLVLPKTEGNVALQGETVGSLYLDGKEAYELYYFSEKAVRSHASLLNTVQSMYPNLTVTAMVVPNSFGVLLDAKTQEKLASSGMDKAISYLYSLMDKRVHTVDAFSALASHKKEYIYFRTDHHWTQLGAYYAYLAFSKEHGFSALPLSHFTKAEYSGFYGTFYFSMNRPEALKANPDTVVAYSGEVNRMHFQDKNGKEGDASLVNDASAMLPGNKYNCFMMGDHPYAEIHNEKGQKNLLVIKDSYANAFLPFLAEHYKNIYVIDYRYYEKKLPELIREKGIEEILFVNNVMGIGQKLSGKMLSLFQ